MGMDETYLVFLLNIQTGEEFVAPVTAPSRAEALARVSAKYPPQQLFAIQTCYPVSELQRLLTEAGRWPGVASAAPRQLNPRVSFGSALPPLPGQQPVAQAAPEQPVVAMIEPSALEMLGQMGQPNPEQRETPALEAEMEANLEVTEEASPAAAPAPLAAPPLPGTRRTVMASIISRKGVADPAASAQDMLKALRH